MLKMYAQMSHRFYFTHSQSTVCRLLSSSYKDSTPNSILHSNNTEWIALVSWGNILTDISSNFVIGSIFSILPMPISGIHKAQVRCTHLEPTCDFLRAPPMLGHSIQWAVVSYAEQGLHNQLNCGMDGTP